PRASSLFRSYFERVPCKTISPRQAHGRRPAGFTAHPLTASAFPYNIQYNPLRRKRIRRGDDVLRALTSRFEGTFMAAPPTQAISAAEEKTDFRPYVPDKTMMPEFTWSAVALGSLLGLVFAGSSLYLVLKIGMTVSASIPVAVLAITLFRAFSRAFGLRRATILENNIVQTAGSAGESIAFGVGVTMPTLLLIGFSMDLPRIMVVSILGGLLGILAMIPLRRAFIVKMHGRPGQP